MTTWCRITVYAVIQRKARVQSVLAATRVALPAGESKLDSDTGNVPKRLVFPRRPQFRPRTRRPSCDALIICTHAHSHCTQFNTRCLVPALALRSPVSRHLFLFPTRLHHPFLVSRPTPACLLLFATATDTAAAPPARTSVALVLRSPARISRWLARRACPARLG